MVNRLHHLGGSWAHLNVPKRHRALLRHGLRALLSLSLGLLLSIGPWAAHAAEPGRAQVQAPAAEPAIAPIPIEEAAARAAEASSLLTSLNKELTPGGDIENVRRQLPDVDGRVTLELNRTLKALKAQPTLETLQSEQELWHKRQEEVTAWLDLLTRRATRLQAALGQLATLEARWRLTLESARSAPLPSAVVRQIAAIPPAIETAQLNFQKQYSTVLDLQGSVAEAAARCQSALSEISLAQQAAMGRMASRERLPIWRVDFWRLGEGRPGLVEIVGAPWADVRHYLADPGSGLPVHLGLFVVLSALMLAIRRQARRWPREESSPVIDSVAARPFAAAMIGALLFATAPLSTAPPTVRNLLSVMAVAALIRLMKPSLDKRMIPALYTLGLLFAFDTLRHALTGAALFDQLTVILEALAGMTVLAWSVHRGSLKRSILKAAGAARFLRPGAQLLLLVLGFGLLAGLMGYLRVARLLVSGVLVGGVLALTLSASVRIVRAVIAFGLRLRPLRLLGMVQRHRDLLERRARRMLILMAVIAWSVRVLDYVGMFQPAVSLGKAVLAAKLERGSISLSLGDVLAFVLTVWASYLLSSFTRFFLEEDVYPRRKVPQGFAYASSRLIHYLLMAVGFLLGLGILGMDLTRVTVLLGAFGVGIGFGLQSVVNNFVSGLILLFERPIHVGDMVEIGSLLGRVRQIGIRASIVRTRQGSEIIVPNSLLVSEQVTNWTYSDRTRRIEMPIGVNYGAAPREVIAVIEAAAADNASVLNHPRPRAIFVGFGDSSLDFELRAWTERFEDWCQVKSELGMAVYDALLAAGFSIPFPQREVRLLKDNTA